MKVVDERLRAALRDLALAFHDFVGVAAQEHGDDDATVVQARGAIRRATDVLRDPRRARPRRCP